MQPERKVMRQHYYPVSEKLKSLIKYISVYQSEEGDKKFLVLPNPGAAIALHREHTFVSVEKNVYQAVSTPGQHSTLVHINRIDPVKICDAGSRESITIVFEPLGINHFIPHSLSHLVKSNSNERSYISQLPFLRGFAEAIFSEFSPESRIQRIEKFLLNRYLDFPNPLVEEALTLLCDLDEIYSLTEISRMIGTSTRNLLRLFNKHICLSPVEFRNIHQFRFSLNKKMEAGKTSLKDIGYESNYSHASYMIRMYQKYTGLNPTLFFDKVSVEGKYVYLSL